MSLGIPEGIPTWGYPLLSLEPYSARVFERSERLSTPRHPTGLAGGLRRMHSAHQGRARSRSLGTLIRLTADSFPAHAGRVLLHQGLGGKSFLGFAEHRVAAFNILSYSYRLS